MEAVLLAEALDSSSLYSKCYLHHRITEIVNLSQLWFPIYKMGMAILVITDNTSERYCLMFICMATSSCNVIHLPYCALFVFHDVYLWSWAIQRSCNSQGGLLFLWRWTDVSPDIYFITRSDTFQIIHDLKEDGKSNHKG